MLMKKSSLRKDQQRTFADLHSSLQFFSCSNFSKEAEWTPCIESFLYSRFKVHSNNLHSFSKASFSFIYRLMFPQNISNTPFGN